MEAHDVLPAKCSDRVATATREELLQQRVSAAEDGAASASAKAAALREEASLLGAANGTLHADCETLRGRLSEAESALAACQACVQVMIPDRPHQMGYSCTEITLGSVVCMLDSICQYLYRCCVLSA